MSDTATSHATRSSPVDIILVDDNEVLGLITRQLLQTAGFHVQFFNTAEEAATVLAGDCPALKLLITDFDLGSATGLELIKLVHDSRPGVRTLLISGTVEPNFLRKQSVQPDHFIAKPFRPAELLETVQRLVAA